MLTNPTYPGVYIEEVSSGVRTIAGVGTSITAFVGTARNGPINDATTLYSFAEYERAFGQLDKDSPLGHAVYHFFLNGGATAIAVRAADAERRARASILATTGTAPVLHVDANMPGVAGNSIRVRIEPSGTDPGSRFAMRVSYPGPDGHIVSEPLYDGLTMGPGENITMRVNGPSQGIRVTLADLSGAPLDPRPALSGTLGMATAFTGPVTGPMTFRVYEGGTTRDIVVTLSTSTSSLDELIPAINTALSGSSDVVLRTVSLRLVSGRVLITASTDRPGVSLDLTDTGPITTALGFGTSGTQRNLVSYALGQTGALLFQSGGVAGVDWSPASLTDLQGTDSAKSGVHALDAVDQFSTLCIPHTLSSQTDLSTLYAHAATYCEGRRAMLLVDVPSSLSSTNRQTLLSGLRAFKNVAAYYPRVLFADPTQGGRVVDFAPSGAVAGVYARTDAERGVWKAPAGVDAALRGAQGLDVTLTEGDLGTLNASGLNCLRTSPLNGTIVWGARTAQGSDSTPSEWKYVPVRRLALYLEESLYRGTQWVVFEPNDEPLWSQIRLNVGAFMQSLFRQGAFQGRTPKEAYLVKCDRDTTTQDDINRGVVNIVVGFAPLKPAEFVMLKIQQLAGQIGT